LGIHFDRITSRVKLKLGLRTSVWEDLPVGKPFMNKNNASEKISILIGIPQTASLNIVSGIPTIKAIPLTIRNIKDRIGGENWSRIFKIAFVRNPWDKVVAQYLYQCRYRTAVSQYPIAFEEWLIKSYSSNREYFMYNEPYAFLTQTEILQDYEGNINLDFIGRFDNFEQDYFLLLEKMNQNKSHISPFKKKIRIKNNTLAYRKYYCSVTKRIVAEYFKEDINNFKFSF
jgi:hypothetical protein